MATEPTTPADDDGFGCGAVIPRASPVLHFATALRVEREREEVEAFGKTVAVTTGDLLAEMSIPSSSARRELPVISHLVRRTMMDAARRIERRPRTWVAVGGGLATVLMLLGIGGGGWLASKWVRGSEGIAEPSAGAVLTTVSETPSPAESAATIAEKPREPDPEPEPAKGPDPEAALEAAKAPALSPPSGAQAKVATKSVVKPAAKAPAKPGQKADAGHVIAGRAPSSHPAAGKPADAKLVATAGAHTPKTGQSKAHAGAGAAGATGHTTPAPGAKKHKKLPAKTTTPARTVPS